MAVSGLDGNIIIAKPNNSLSPKGFVWLFAGIVAITMVVALGVTLIGAWFVLPFAGLEVLAFACAFHHVYMHYEDFESITLEGNNVIVEKHSCNRSEKFTFQRYWAKVMLRDTLDGACGLFIGSHGKEVEFGKRFMSDEQRVAIARQLKQQLKNND